jgi:hypothetical protein
MVLSNQKPKKGKRIQKAVQFFRYSLVLSLKDGNSSSSTLIIFQRASSGLIYISIVCFFIVEVLKDTCRRLIYVILRDNNRRKGEP